MAGNDVWDFHGSPFFVYWKRFSHAIGYSQSKASVGKSPPETKKCALFHAANHMYVI